MLTHSELLQLLSYDQYTGQFTRLVRRTNCGTGWKDSSGYLQICVASKTYAIHRLAWFYVSGEWPKGDIDHINGDKTDNRIVNLRDVPEFINMQNERRARKNNSSGFMGVSYRKDRKKWVATIRVNGKTKRLGSFATPEEAHNAYLEGKRLYHPGFTL